MSVGPNKILVVDDDKSTLFSFQAYLDERSKGLVSTLAKVDMVKDAEAMMQSSKEDWPNIIVLDGNMPGKDPIEFIEFLIKAEYTGKLFLCSDDPTKSQKMIDLIQENIASVHFEFADTMYHTNNTHQKMKGDYFYDFWLQTRASQG